MVFNLSEAITGKYDRKKELIKKRERQRSYVQNKSQNESIH